jgi:hypothetical protein
MLPRKRLTTKPVTEDTGFIFGVKIYSNRTTTSTLSWEGRGQADYKCKKQYGYLERREECVLLRFMRAEHDCLHGNAIKAT